MTKKALKIAARTTRLRMSKPKTSTAAVIRRNDSLDPRMNDFIPKPVGLLSDRQIRAYAKEQGMISPFCERTAPEGKISWGLSSYGYDARVGNKFKVFTNVHNAIVDPKNFDPSCFVDIEADVCVIPPNSFVLCHTIEHFKMPRNVSAIVVSRSTYARVGIQTLATPLESSWEGILTLEFANTTPLPVKLYANEGACQILFFAGTDICETSYADRKGKYMHQVGITLPRMEKVAPLAKKKR